MANVTVVTTPPGVYPISTVSITDTTYAQVEADVLRRQQGVLLEDTAARDAADNVIRAGHTAPKITLQPTDESAEEGANATFDITVTGSPAPEVEWLVQVGDGPWQHQAYSTDLTLTAVTLGMDGNRYKAIVKNYKSQVETNVVTLTVTEAA